MTFVHRLNLLAFGLFTWSAAMFTAANAINNCVATAAPFMAAIGGGLFATALLPGRMARFS